MSNHTLAQQLQFQGQEGRTGCLLVQNNGDAGRVYFHHGKVVYAETKRDKGLLAFFMMLTWPQSSIEWEPDQPASTVVFEEPVDTLLFQFAQLEDTGQADEASLVSLFRSNGTAEIKLTELKHYLITLEVLNAEFHGMTFTLTKGKNLVGRSEDCDIVLPDPTVTSHHCIIVQENNCIHVTDLGSTNGTFINGKDVTHAILQVGDDLFLGQVGLRMAMKMQRKLAAANDSPIPAKPATVPIARPKINAQPPPDPRNGSYAAPHTSQAISWKSIEEENQHSFHNKNKTSFLGRIFGH